MPSEIVRLPSGEMVMIVRDTAAYDAAALMALQKNLAREFSTQAQVSATILTLQASMMETYKDPAACCVNLPVSKPRYQPTHREPAYKSPRYGTPHPGKVSGPQIGR